MNRFSPWPRRIVGAVLLVLFALLFASSAVTQTVTVENLGPTPFDGWHRLTVDTKPVHAIGWKGVGVAQPITGGGLQQQTDAVYVLGRRVGLETWVVDVRARLAPGQRRVLNLATFAPTTMPLPQLRRDALAFFGGSPSVNGGTMGLPVGLELSAADLIGFLLSHEAANESVCVRIEDLTRDGAALHFHFRARVPGTRMLVAELWVRWYPGAPAFAHGEALVTCSNPAVADLHETATNGVHLSFGDARVFVLGGAEGVIVPPGTVFADGQARAVPVTFVWTRHAFDGNAAVAHMLAAVQGVGITKLLADGNPTYAPSTSARAWARPFLSPSAPGQLAPAIAWLHNWSAIPIGAAPNSTVTGAQEDQVFVRGEALLPEGPPAAFVTYLAALRMAARPCQHLEADATPLDPARHPQLRFWDGRPHWSANMSPDQLGKSTHLTVEQAAGWWGPDVQHWLMNTLAAGTRLTGSPLCQRLLRNQATVYLLQRSADPAVATSANESAREVGWEGIGVVHLWRELEDRAMAQRVVDRWRARVVRIILPTWGPKPGDVWDVRTDVSSAVPVVPGYMPWQQAVGAYGLDLACAIVGPVEGRALALRGAKRVLADAWVQEGSRWVEYDRVALSGAKSRSGFYATAWLPLAVATVLRHEPANAKARAVWDQIVADAVLAKQTAWLPPSVPQ